MLKRTGFEVTDLHLYLNLTTSLAWGKFLDVFMSLLVCKRILSTNSFNLRLLWGLNELKEVRCLTQCLGLHKCSANIGFMWYLQVARGAQWESQGKFLEYIGLEMCFEKNSALFPNKLALRGDTWGWLIFLNLLQSWFGTLAFSVYTPMAIIICTTPLAQTTEGIVQLAIVWCVWIPP